MFTTNEKIEIVKCINELEEKVHAIYDCIDRLERRLDNLKRD